LRLQINEATMSSKKNLLIFGIYAFVFGLLFAFYMLTINYFSKFPEKTDFYKFYKSARFFIEGESIYTPVPFSPPDEYLNKLSEKARGTLKTFHPNLNSPFHTLFMVPLGIMPFHLAFWVWSLLSLFFGLVAVGLIETTQTFHEYKILLNGVIDQRQKTDGRENRAPLGGWLYTHSVHLLIPWIILLAYYPMWVNFQMGQFGPYLLGVIALIWLTAGKGNVNSQVLFWGLPLVSRFLWGYF
jgi:hypothetical protein